MILVVTDEAGIPRNTVVAGIADKFPEIGFEAALVTVGSETVTVGVWLVFVTVGI